jgi:parallel beta-helix repeat protein
MNKSKTMNTKIRALFISTTSLLLALSGDFDASAQGSLTPPGFPAPTMKTLDQVEARTPIGSAPFTITGPGSYYLTGNLSGAGITIKASNVTLDLNGFTIEGGLDDYYGILILKAQTNITVRNGTISGWQEGGVFDDVGTYNLVLERLNLSDNLLGITARGSNTVVRDCVVLSSGLEGITCRGNSTISDCVSSGNGMDGIDSAGGTLTGCTIEDNGKDGLDCSGSITVTGSTISGNDLAGIYASGSAVLVTGCIANDNGDSGIFCEGGKVADCIANNNSGNGGIFADSATVSGCVLEGNQCPGILMTGSDGEAIGNTCIGNNSGNTTGGGIYASSANSRIEGNHVTGSGYAGINVDSGTGNVIIKNSVAGNGANNYLIATGNDLGPVGTAATSFSAWANISH